MYKYHYTKNGGTIIVEQIQEHRTATHPYWPWVHVYHAWLPKAAGRPRPVGGRWQRHGKYRRHLYADNVGFFGRTCRNRRWCMFAARTVFPTRGNLARVHYAYC